jgi:hypothetical protein
MEDGMMGVDKYWFIILVPCHLSVQGCCCRSRPFVASEQDFLRLRKKTNATARMVRTTIMIPVTKPQTTADMFSFLDGDDDGGTTVDNDDRKDAVKTRVAVMSLK